MAKRRGKGNGSKLLLVVTSIAMLGAMGVSYGYWNDSLDIFTSISTGKMDVRFCPENYKLEEKKGETNNFDVTFSRDESNRHVMTITGEVTPDFKAFLHYCVINNGDIPVKLVEEITENVQLNHQNGVLRPGDFDYNPNGDPKIHIDASNFDENKNEYSFSVTLKFGQWNK